MIPESPPNHFLISGDDIRDVAHHYEIKCRAYELYDRRYDAVARQIRKVVPDSKIIFVSQVPTKPC